MRSFLKDNIAIVAAIALPALLAFVFMLSTLFYRVSVADPRHDFFIASDYNESTTSFRLDIVNDRLIVSYRPPEPLAQGGFNYGQKPRLWRVRVPAMSVEEISLIEPADKKAATIPIAGVTDVPVRNIQPGPDGYLFTENYRYDRNIMNEIFGGGGYNSYGLALIKQGRVVPIRTTNDNQWDYYNARFIGWIVDQP